MIHRYLRIYYVEPDGRMIGPGRVSNALVPAMTVPGTLVRARDLVRSATRRRSTVASALATELQRARRVERARYHGVALVLCETSTTAAASSQYRATWAALRADLAIVTGALSAGTLDHAVLLMFQRIAAVLGTADETSASERDGQS